VLPVETGRLQVLPVHDRGKSGIYACRLFVALCQHMRRGTRTKQFVLWGADKGLSANSRS
jgi:hypothetical protein